MRAKLTSMQDKRTQYVNAVAKVESVSDLIGTSKGPDNYSAEAVQSPTESGVSYLDALRAVADQRKTIKSKVETVQSAISTKTLPRLRDHLEKLEKEIEDLEKIIVAYETDLSEFIRLKADGLITKEEYEKAKEALMVKYSESTPVPTSEPTSEVLLVAEPETDDTEMPGSLIDQLDQAGDGLEAFVPSAVNLEEIKTLSDMERVGETVDPKTCQYLEELSKLVTSVDYSLLTPEEVGKLHAFVQEKSKMDRHEISASLVDFCAVILQAAHSYLPLPQRIVDAAKRIEDAERDGSINTYSPQDRSLKLVAAGALVVCSDLISRHTQVTVYSGVTDFVDQEGYREDHGSKAFSQAVDSADVNPLVILTLQKMQELVLSRRAKGLFPEIQAKFEELVEFHAELVLKLQKRGISLEELFGSEQAKALWKAAQFVRSIRSYSGQYGKITARQEISSLPSYQEYRTAIMTLARFNPVFMEILQEPLERTKGDVQSARREVLYRLDDGALSKKKENMLKHGLLNNCQTINVILRYLNPDFNRHDKKYDSFIQIAQLSDAAIEKYMAMTADEKNSMVDAVMAETIPQSPEKKAAILTAFCEIVDQYC